MALKAYSVNDYEGERGTVVFAKRYVNARREGAAEIDAEFGDVDCHRIPELDKYADNQAAVTMELLVEEYGWWSTCMHCERRLSAEQGADDEEDEETEARGPRVWKRDGTAGWCGMGCCEGHAREIEDKRCREAAAMAEVARRFPDADALHFHDQWNHQNKRYTATVSFKLPPLEFRATWSADAPESLTVAQKDKPAFEEWRKQRVTQ